MRTRWRILAIAALLVVLLAILPASAQDSRPTMIVRPGMDGYCIVDKWCPVRVILSNDGAGFEGQVQIEIDTPYGNDLYSHPVVLPTGSRKAYFLHIPAVSSFEIRLLSGERTLIHQSIRAHILDLQDRLYGIVGENPSAFNFLSDVTPRGGQTAVAHLETDELSSSYLGWETLDMLVVNNADTSAFSEEQLQALETWVSLGGHLLVGGGPGGPQTAAAVAHLLPVDVGTVRTVDNLAALGTYVDATVTPGPYVVTDAALRDGAEALLQQGDLVLLARRPLGMGVVSFVAFDAALNPFATRREDRAHLWELLTEVQPNRKPGLSIADTYSARDAVAAIPNIKPLSIWQILIFLLAYTVLIGPLNYLLLRRFDRRELAWLTIPLLAFGFTACAYLTGFQIRGTRPILHQLEATYVPAGSQTGQVAAVIGVFSPRRAYYDIRANNAAFSRLKYYLFALPTTDEDTLSVEEDGNTHTVRRLRLEVGGLETLQAEGVIAVSPPTASLQILTDEGGEMWLRGTIQNGAIPLQDAYITAGRSVYHLGELEPHQQITVNTKMGSTDATAQILDSSDDYYSDLILYRRYTFLEAINFHGQPGVYLVGWSDETALDVEIVGQQARHEGTALYVFGLPATSISSGHTILLRPNRFGCQIEESSGSPELPSSLDCSEPFSLPPESSVTLRFTVWPETTVTQVALLQLTLIGSSYTDPPQVLLWNWESEKWDAQVVSWNDNQIPNPHLYVRSDGTVRLQLYVPSSGSYTTIQELALVVGGER